MQETLYQGEIQYQLIESKLVLSISATTEYLLKEIKKYFDKMCKTKEQKCGLIDTSKVLIRLSNGGIDGKNRRLRSKVLETFRVKYSELELNFQCVYEHIKVGNKLSYAHTSHIFFKPVETDGHLSN